MGSPIDQVVADQDGLVPGQTDELVLLLFELECLFCPRDYALRMVEIAGIDGWIGVSLTKRKSQQQQLASTRTS